VRWLWVLLTVLGGIAGDLLNAKGMASRGEIQDLGPRGLVRVVHYIATNRLVVSGIACDAVSFAALLALLSITKLSFAVPVTALSTIFKTALAQWYLNERVTGRRWAGAVLVAAGIVLISI